MPKKTNLFLQLLLVLAFTVYMITVFGGPSFWSCIFSPLGTYLGAFVLFYAYRKMENTDIKIDLARRGVVPAVGQPLRRGPRRLYPGPKIQQNLRQKLRRDGPQPVRVARAPRQAGQGRHQGPCHPGRLVRRKGDVRSRDRSRWTRVRLRATCSFGSTSTR